MFYDGIPHILVATITPKKELTPIKSAPYLNTERKHPVKGDLPPTTLRQLFNDLRNFIQQFVYFASKVYYDLVTLAVVLSFWISVPPAVPLLDLLGGLGSGKTTLLFVLSTLCRSGMLSSICTSAALARSRMLDQATLCIDEPIRNPNHPILLGSYKKGSTRMVCGPGNQLLVQSVYGLLLKVYDRSSEALKDRAISIEIAPCRDPLPAFDAYRERNRIQDLRDRLFWLTLTHYREFEERLEQTFRNLPLTGRAAEKWSSLCAVARCVDASDPDEVPIYPGIETLMLENTRLQREERVTTDPQLLVLVGLQDYLSRQSIAQDQTDVDLAIADFTEFVSRRFDLRFVPQQVSALLRLHGLVTSAWRSRRLGSATFNTNGNAKTLVRINLTKLQAALRNHDLEEAPREREVTR